MVRPIWGDPRDRLQGSPVRLECRKQAGGMQEDSGGDGRGQTTSRVDSGLCVMQSH